MASGPETVSYGWPIASNFPKTTFISNAVPVFKRLSAMVLFLHPGLAFGSEDSLVLLQDWLPLSVGDRWIYQADMRDGNRQHPEIRRWQQEETITAIRTLPEGVLIERKVKFLNNTIPPSWVQQSRSREAHILFHDACLYYLGDSPSFGPDYGWSSTHHEFTASFRQALARNAALPDICLPLQPGKTWGDPKKGRNLWMVAGRGKKNFDDPSSITAQCWRLEASLSSGDNNYLWFQKGIGVTGTRTFHNGTYHDEQTWLLRFEQGSSHKQQQ